MSDARGRGVARQLHSAGQAGQASGQPGGQTRSSGRKAKPRAPGWRQRFGFIIAFVMARPDSDEAQTYRRIARRVWEKAAAKADAAPKIVME